jgi:hypothetical protein
MGEKRSIPKDARQYTQQCEQLLLRFEVDDYGKGGWRKPSSIIEPVDLLEWLTLNMRSLQNQCVKIGVCVIKRSGQGYHISFPNCPPLTMDEFNKFLLLVPHDIGWAWWSSQYGRATLRIGAKPIVSTVKGEFSKQLGTRIDLNKPQTIRLIYPDGTILRRKEIEERFGNDV